VRSAHDKQHRGWLDFIGHGDRLSLKELMEHFERSVILTALAAIGGNKPLSTTHMEGK
jgi:hypothetical protein